MSLRKSIEWFTRLLPLWTIIGGVIAFIKPALFLPLRKWMDGLFMFTMLGIGAVLDYRKFIPVFKRYYIVIIGSSAQYLIMPLSAFVIAKWLNLPPELAVGLIIAGSVPGAMASNVISYLAKADVAYSISLTTLSTLLSPLFTPALTWFLARSILEIKFWEMFFSIIKLVIIPLLAGFGIRYFLKRVIDRITVVFPAFSTIFIVLICALVIALNQGRVVLLGRVLFLAVVMLNLAGLCGGYGVGRLFRLTLPQRRALSIEIGMQNAGLGAVLSLRQFTPQTALPCVIFATWCVITASILAEVWANKGS